MSQTNGISVRLRQARLEPHGTERGTGARRDSRGRDQVHAAGKQNDRLKERRSIHLHSSIRMDTNQVSVGQYARFLDTTSQAAPPDWSVGNVWEGVSDWYDPDYYQASPSKNPTGPPTSGRLQSDPWRFVGQRSGSPALRRPGDPFATVPGPRRRVPVGKDSVDRDS